MSFSTGIFRVVLTCAMSRERMIETITPWRVHASHQVLNW
jgi:hypothetical protein